MIGRLSRFEFGAGAFQTTLPVLAWVPAEASIGGARISSAGIPASYIVRRDELLNLTLRLEESEWDDFLAFLRYGQTAEPITWFPDIAEEADYGIECYLHEPAFGVTLTPVRSAEYPRVLEVSIVLRRIDGDLWTPYFQE